MKSLFNSKRKILSAALALALVLALTVTAFASPASGWPSFQSGTGATGVNNGTIDNGTPPTNTAPSPSPVPSILLPYNGTIFSGIDTESVINGNIAYTLYNGGTVVGGSYGGARVQATDFSAYPTITQSWNVELFDSNAGGDIHADNVSQLSSPLLINNTLFAAKSTASTVYQSSDFTPWTVGGGASVSSGIATFPANSKSFIQSPKQEVQLSQPVSTLLVQTDLNAGGSTNSTYTITLTGTSQSYTLVQDVQFSGSYGTYYTYNGVTIPADNYTITLNVTAGSDAATASWIKLGRYDWALYEIPLSSPSSLKRRASGEGQANTPITTDGNGNVYWGVWGGARSYYQYAPSSGALGVFTPNSGAGDNFYGAGAALVNNGSASYMVFGSDSGTLYARPLVNFGSGVGYSYSNAAGTMIRSSIVTETLNSYGYFTSYSGNKGTLWQFKPTTIGSATLSIASTALAYASTSTPVCSDQYGFIYVGMNDGFTSGRVDVFTAGPLGWLSTLYDGDPVQSSPIVYSNYSMADDYVYFTTNSAGGKGYCYQSIGTASYFMWSAGGTSSNPYAVQGFSSNNGYLVYGDDANTLYIMH